MTWLGESAHALFGCCRIPKPMSMICTGREAKGHRVAMENPVTIAEKAVILEAQFDLGQRLAADRGLVKPLLCINEVTSAQFGRV
jgi:hypothetical protein